MKPWLIVSENTIVQGVARRHSPLTVVVCVLVLTSLCPGIARAQAIDPVVASPDPTRAPNRPTRIYVGMWTTHLKEEVLTLDNNWVAGASWRGYFGATFLNSYRRRAFTGGIERHFFSTAERRLRAAAGFRLGFITGYDGQMMKIADDTPVLPLIQPFFTLDVSRIGFDVSYTFVVVSVAVSYRLSD